MKRPGWKQVEIRLTRADAIALLKTLKFARTSFQRGAAFLAPIERASVEHVENAVRDAVGRGRGREQLARADEIVDDYVKLYLRKIKVNR